MKTRTVVAFFIAALLMTVSLVAYGADDSLKVKNIGSFYVGGHEITLSELPVYNDIFTQGGPVRKVDPNGSFETGQMYVQYVQLKNPKAKYPILLWHGGGLSGATWETKPDGNPGWQMFFLKAGYNVYVSDAVERGRSSWSRYPEIYKSNPIFRTKKESWESFRIGPTYDDDPAKRIPYSGGLFPAESFDQFMKSAIPRWTTNNQATQEAYDKLVQTVGPSVIVVHSQSGAFGERAVLNAPEKVKAVVLLEPSGAPDPTKENLALIKNIPHLYIWGDNIDKYPTWPKYYANVARYRDALIKTGVPVTWIELPKMGIKGNSHMLMMDKNSDQIAEIVQKWLESQKIMK
ncbi:MAG: esterase [Firmicutes bacterium]|nr:esterase [Bacillota bacterium]